MQNIAKLLPSRQCQLNRIKSVNISYSAQSIISAENRDRTLQCLQSSPPLRMQSKTPEKYAAVLIPICINSVTDEVSILFTKRSGKLSRHVYQNSFPGGIKDPTDASFEDCALRETEEEIGLSRDRIQLWGQGALIRPPHTAAIMPVIGLINDLQLDELNINKDEVEEAFTISLDDLCAKTNRGYTQFKSGYSSAVFVVGNYKIWGITGFLTNVFLKCLLPNEFKYDSKTKFISPYRVK